MIAESFSSAIDAGIGVGISFPDESRPMVEADPLAEYVAGNMILAPGNVAGPSGADTPTQWHGVGVYEAMYGTPAIGSSFNALRAAVLSGGIGLLPAIAPSTGQRSSGQARGTAEDAVLAMEIADSNRRTLDAWDTPADVVLWEMMESMYLGYSLAEKVYRRVEDGPDAGRLAVASVRTKPRWSHRFLVDRALNVVGIGAYTVDGKWEQFEPDHFAWLTWDARHNDPRGRSCFRMAHHAWTMLMRLWPEIEKGWFQFGTPWTFLTTAPNSPKNVPLRDASGNPIAGRTITSEQALAAAGMQLRNGKVVAAPNGAEAKVIESTKDATVVSGAISVLESEMIRAILLQIRATVEAKHGSKADGEIGQDIMGTLVRFVRKWLERFVRRILIGQNELNYPGDVARRLTPLVTLGDHEHQDFAANAAGVALLHQSGFFTEDQYPALDTLLGMPQRVAGSPRVGPQKDNAAAATTPAPADPKGVAA